MAWWGTKADDDDDDRKILDLGMFTTEVLCVSWYALIMIVGGGDSVRTRTNKKGRRRLR